MLAESDRRRLRSLAFFYIFYIYQTFMRCAASRAWGIRLCVCTYWVGVHGLVVFVDGWLSLGTTTYTSHCMEFRMFLTR